MGRGKGSVKIHVILARGRRGMGASRAHRIQAWPIMAITPHAEDDAVDEFRDENMGT